MVNNNPGTDGYSAFNGQQELEVISVVFDCLRCLVWIWNLLVKGHIEASTALKYVTANVICVDSMRTGKMCWCPTVDLIIYKRAKILDKCAVEHFGDTLSTSSEGTRNPATFLMAWSKRSRTTVWQKKKKKIRGFPKHWSHACGYFCLQHKLIMTEFTDDSIVSLGYLAKPHFSHSHFQINIIFITQPETYTWCEVYHCW